MSGLWGLNKLMWYLRVPIKCVIFAVTLFAVCFPDPARFLAHLRHWGDPNALIEPDAPALQPLVDELRGLITDDLSASEALKTVQDFVYHKIEYQWDWDTWGTADYLPTVTEATEIGKEDCDGRAVVAASLLRNLGYESEIVTDFLHVWVKTDKGETMHPGAKKAVVATDRGLKVHAEALAQVPKAIAYGIAVFPLARELIVLAVLWLLLLRPHGGVVCSLAALGFLVSALFFLRIGSRDHQHPILWLQVVALANALAVLVSILAWARHNAQLADRHVDKDHSAPAAGL